MNELWFIPLMGVLALVSTILSTKGSLYDNRFKWYKRLTSRGKVVAFLGLCIVGLSIWQYVSAKKENSKKEKLQARQIETRDSTITAEVQKGIDSNRIKLFQDLSEALAKQSLRLDTVTNNLKSLRDSAKTVIYNSPKESSILIVRGNGIVHHQKSDSIEFRIALISTQAPCTLLYVNYLCELNFVDGTKGYTMISKFIRGRVIMPKDQPLSQTFELYTSKEIMVANIALFGKYTGQDHDNQVKYEALYSYSFETKQTGLISEEDRKTFYSQYRIN